MAFQDFSHSTASTRRAKSVDRFCEDFGISRSTLYEQVRRGRLRLTKLGKKSIILTERQVANPRSDPWFAAVLGHRLDPGREDE